MRQRITVRVPATEEPFEGMTMNLTCQLCHVSSTVPIEPSALALICARLEGEVWWEHTCLPWIEALPKKEKE